jgi:heat shock protein HslJ
MSKHQLWFVLTCALLLGVPLVTGCGGETMDPATLEGVEWQLADSSATDVDLTAAGITAAFDGENVSGFAGVNQYGGPYTAGDDGSLEIGEIASTLMAGPEPLMQAEGAYLAALKGCDGWEVGGDTLTLTTGDEDTLIFEKAAEVSLPGTSWNVTAYNNGKDAVRTLVEDSAMTIEFGTDDTVAGDAGVNRYNGPYTLASGELAIGPLATTKMAGEPELMAQEQAFLAALEATVTWRVVRGALELRDENGAAMVVAEPAK